MLIFLYMLSCILLILGSVEYLLGLIRFDYCVFIIGSDLVLLQVALALHLYWKQILSEDEFMALIVVFDNVCRRAIVKRIHDSGSTWMSELARDSRFSSTRISGNLMELERAGIIIAESKFLPNSSRALKMYSICPKYRNLIGKTRSHL